MRAVAQALLASHPIVAAGLLALRWCGWVVVGHPAGLVMYALAWRLGAPVLASIVAAVMLDLILVALGATAVGRDRSGILAAPWLWARCCRFRRRWPTTALLADPRRDTSLSILHARNYYTGPDGYRPILAVPALSLVPRGVAPERAEVWWVVRRPRVRQSLRELTAQLAALPLVDRDVADAQLVQSVTGPGRHRLQIRIRFAPPGGHDHTNPRDGRWRGPGHDGSGLGDDDGAGPIGGRSPGHPSGSNGSSNGDRPHRPPDQDRLAS